MSTVTECMRHKDEYKRNEKSERNSLIEKKSFEYAALENQVRK